MADFAFFMGDLNYRLDTTFADLNNSNVMDDAIPMVQGKGDQLMVSRDEGFYPGYVEPLVEFLPTYKMEFNKAVYKEKKNQAPSYTDRILFKNNSNFKFCDDYYRCLHNVYGSDHRPVIRGITIKGFGYPQFAEV